MTTGRPKFDPGDEVFVVGLRRHGRVLEVLHDRCRVAVESLVVVVDARDLRTPQPGKTRKRPAPAPDTRSAGDESVRRVDLHGLTTEAAREVLLDALNDAVLSGAARLEVVHGIGTGRVRAVVLQELERVAAVRHVRPHPTNKGITIVQL